jgi:hypothetical protein
MHRLHLQQQRGVAVAEPRPRARFHLLPRMQQRRPSVAVELAEEQAFDRTAARIPMPQQARGHHPRVVHRQHVAGTEKAGKIGNPHVAPGAVAPVDDEQSRPSPRGRRLLRNQVVGKIEVEL